MLPSLWHEKCPSLMFWFYSPKVRWEPFGLDMQPCDSPLCAKSDMGFSPQIGEVPFDILSSIYPTVEQSVAPEDTPEQVAADYTEAYSSYQNANYKAASIMTRAALETGLKMLNADGNSLYAKIANLVNVGKLTQELADWAHEIRIIGNEAAHEVSTPAKEDVEDALHFAAMLFLYLFTMPEMAKRRRIAS